VVRVWGWRMSVRSGGPPLVCELWSSSSGPIYAVADTLTERPIEYISAGRHDRVTRIDEQPAHGARLPTCQDLLDQFGLLKLCHISRPKPEVGA
jgi:hypothetical protein